MSQEGHIIVATPEAIETGLNEPKPDPHYPKGPSLCEIASRARRLASTLTHPRN